MRTNPTFATVVSGRIALVFSRALTDFSKFSLVPYKLELTSDQQFLFTARNQTYFGYHTRYKLKQAREKEIFPSRNPRWPIVRLCLVLSTLQSCSSSQYSSVME